MLPIIFYLRFETPIAINLDEDEQPAEHANICLRQGVNKRNEAAGRLDQDDTPIGSIAISRSIRLLLHESFLNHVILYSSNPLQLL